ncbi:MAG: hypothetical protein ABIT47_03350 [Candidatus Paceibacterota bacterium]
MDDNTEVEVVTPEEGAEVVDAPTEMPAHEVPTPTSSSDEGMEADEATEDGDDTAEAV